MRRREVELEPRSGSGERAAPPNAGHAAAGRLCLVALLAFVVPASLAGVTDTDYGWHLRAGREMLASGTIPVAESWSHTASGEPWFAHEWLTEVGIAWLDSILGYRGPTALFALVTAAAWALVWLHARARSGPLVATALAFAGAFVARPPANVRPQLLTLLLVAIVAFLLDGLRADGRAARRVWLLPPLFALWANLHGGFTIGLALLAGALVAEATVGTRGERSLRLLPVLAVSVAACALNPRGPALLVYALGYADASRHGSHLIAEWQPPDLASPEALVLLLLAGAFLALALARRGAPRLHVLWMLGLVPLAFLSRRHGPLLAVVIVPALAAQVALAAPRLAGLRPTAKRALALVGASIAAVAISIATGEAPLQLGRRPSAIGYPTEAARALAARGGGRLFNEYGWGGYLLAELPPGFRVWIDGRADIYGARRVEEHAGIAAARGDWRRKLDLLEVDCAVVRAEGPLAAALASEPGWREIARGEVERVFERVR